MPEMALGNSGPGYVHRQLEYLATLAREKKFAKAADAGPRVAAGIISAICKDAWHRTSIARNI